MRTFRKFTWSKGIDEMIQDDMISERNKAIRVILYGYNITLSNEKNS